MAFDYDKYEELKNSETSVGYAKSLRLLKLSRLAINLWFILAPLSVAGFLIFKMCTRTQSKDLVPGSHGSAAAVYLGAKMLRLTP